MKITKRGTPKAERIWKGKCSSCDTEAEATELEMKHIEYDQREQISFCWMTCPVCNVGPFNGLLFYPKKS